MEAEKLSDTEATLLIVDDEPLMTDLFRQSMTRHGFRVLTATGGKEALEIVAKEPVDLVITDMTMPGMDGVTFAHALFAQLPHLKTLIATGHDADAVQMGAPPNVIGIIKKPYQHKALAQHIREILAGE
jgi:two-component system cell cycle sensor histidine kinase/response regulator CckA